MAEFDVIDADAPTRVACSESGAPSAPEVFALPGAAELQFYPTHAAQADRVFAKFNDGNVERLLDACASTGALADAYARTLHARHYHRGTSLAVDCVEIDPRHHTALREKGYAVVGMEFLEFAGGAAYSHVMLNLPFSRGAAHARPSPSSTTWPTCGRRWPPGPGLGAGTGDPRTGQSGPWPSAPPALNGRASAFCTSRPFGGGTRALPL